jgi:predicted HTH transcriptional regulator
MEPFPDVSGLEIFPGMESHTMEFKLSLSNIIKSNCPRTICSFLNAKGGYIVFGIEDKQRRIVGINADSAELDEYLKWFDSFYHTKRITDSKGNPLHPGTLEPRIVTVSPAKYIVVLAIRPRPNTAYKCQDGTAWHRLGASVYSFQEGATEKELMALKDDLRNEKEKHAIALSRISCLRTDMRRIVGAAKDVDDQLDKFAKAVSHDILTRKAKMELYLMKQNNWLSYLFCNC